MLFRWKHYAEGYDFGTLKEYIRLFPTSQVTNMIRGYISYMDLPTLDPDPKDKDIDDEIELAVMEDQSAAFDLMLASFLSFR